MDFSAALVGVANLATRAAKPPWLPAVPGTDGYIEWNQLTQPPLGFPRGEAGFFDKRHFGTDWQKRLMRGGDG